MRHSRGCTAGHGHAGFTYLGLMLFLALLSLVTVGAVTLGSLAQRRADENELLDVGRQYIRAIGLYYAATPIGTAHFPRTLDDLLSDPRFRDRPHRYLRRRLADPLTRSFDWGVVSSPEGGIAGVYSHSELKPIKVAVFPSDLIKFDKARHYTDWVFAFVPPAQASQAAAGGR